MKVEFPLTSCHILITYLSTVRFSENVILKVIRKLDPSIAHCHDKICKLSSKAICRPLQMIFTSCLETGFSSCQLLQSLLRFVYIGRILD